MNWLVGIALSALLGAVAHYLASYFGGPCPASWGSACTSWWPAIAAAVTAALAALGYGKATTPATLRAGGPTTALKASPSAPPAPDAKRVTDVLPDAPAAGDAPAAEGAAQPAPGAPDSIVSEQDRDRIWSGP